MPVPTEAAGEIVPSSSGSSALRCQANPGVTGLRPVPPSERGDGITRVSAPATVQPTGLATTGAPYRSRRHLRTALFVAACVMGGCGLDSDKRNPTSTAMASRRPASIETVLELDEPPGNVTVSSDGRVFFTFHPAALPTVHVAEVTGGGDFAAFPDEGWQAEREGAPFFVSPLSLRADDREMLWILDHGDFGRHRPSLTAFDLVTREIVHRHEFSSDIAGRGSMLNDFWVDGKSDTVYIADTSPLAFEPALIVYDIETGVARRLLEDHVSVRAESHHTVVQGRFLRMFGLPLRVAVDSIALSRDGRTLYFGPLTGATLYSVDTAALLDDSLTAEALRARVRAHGRKPATDGIAADSDGRIYLTAIEHDAIWVLTPEGSLSALAADSELLSWPDGVDLSADGTYLYISASELHHVLGADLDQLPLRRPFRLLRLRLREDSGAEPVGP